MDSIPWPDREREREWILKSIPAETIFPKSISFPSISVPEILLEFGLKIVFYTILNEICAFSWSFMNKNLISSANLAQTSGFLLQFQLRNPKRE